MEKRASRTYGNYHSVKSEVGFVEIEINTKRIQGHQNVHHHHHLNVLWVTTIKTKNHSASHSTSLRGACDAEFEFGTNGGLKTVINKVVLWIDFRERKDFMFDSSEEGSIRTTGDSEYCLVPTWYVLKCALGFRLDSRLLFSPSFLLFWSFFIIFLIYRNADEKKYDLEAKA